MTRAPFHAVSACLLPMFLGGIFCLAQINEKTPGYFPVVIALSDLSPSFAAKHTHAPHPSKWHCPGHTPALFKKLLEKAVVHVRRHDMPRVLTCYNVAEWAEGGPGLQPNMQDRFGYLKAVRDALRGLPDHDIARVAP